MPNGDAETCQVRIKCDPENLAIWIAGPVPGDCDDPDCNVDGTDFEGVPTSNGEAVIELQCGARYCLRYYGENGTPGYLGGVDLHCDDATERFDSINALFTSGGFADGRACFCVTCC